MLCMGHDCDRFYAFIVSMQVEDYPTLVFYPASDKANPVIFVNMHPFLWVVIFLGTQ